MWVPMRQVGYVIDAPRFMTETRLGSIVVFMTVSLAVDAGEV